MDSLLDAQTEVQQIMGGGLTSVDPDGVEELILSVRGDVVTLRDEWRFVMPLMPALSWLPRVGAIAQNASQFMTMADQGTTAAAYAIRGLKPGLVYLQDEGNTGDPIPAMLQVVDEARPDLAQASLAMDQVAAARAELQREDELPWRVRTLLEQADQWLPLGQGGLKASLVLPAMMGLDGPRRYLVIAQNEDELRANGGFISGAGLVEIDQGRITNLLFEDANKVDAWANKQFTSGGLTKPYGDPPPRLRELMFLDLFLFRDANYWPDFPVSAEKAMALYSYGQNVPPLDGAIAIDQAFVEKLLAGLGPVMLPETAEVFNQNNVVANLQDSWSLDGNVADRKSFLGPLAAAILNRVQNNFDSVQEIELARQLGTSLARKDLQIYMIDPAEAAVMAEARWDGGLNRPANSDALLVLDSNFGYNKANYFVERDVDYQVQLDETGGGTADLTVVHSHRSPDDGEACFPGAVEEYRQGAGYLALAEKCYWNYLRVYTPQGSSLIEGPQNAIQAENWLGDFTWNEPAGVIEELSNFVTFDTFFLLPQGLRSENRFTYSLPPEVTMEQNGQTHYRLRLFRQAGSPNYRTQVAVTLPPGATLTRTHPAAQATDNGTVFFVLDTSEDTDIEVVYE